MKSAGSARRVESAFHPHQRLTPEIRTLTEEGLSEGLLLEGRYPLLQLVLASDQVVRCVLCRGLFVRRLFVRFALLALGVFGLMF